MRQIILDTETTGIEPKSGHRIIEIGCVEMINRRLTGNNYHQYIQPEREVPQEAIEIHGITNEFLTDKPLYGAIADDFLQFIKGAELIIHNAAFDIGFINHEFKLLNGQFTDIRDHCTVVDTLAMARKKHPGQRNSLDALCKRYFIDNTKRELHGALLDSEILADVYLAMTGGQRNLSLDSQGDDNADTMESADIQRLKPGRAALKVVTATASELEEHDKQMQLIDKKSGSQAIWFQSEVDGVDSKVVH
ncbi:MAG: DNA polymerase III subunit epsilon [Gammaproteobacteria bacterium]|nr:DNA polymerase III subunit epsilon [Gammaproteobacteria bacterium]MCF6230324.1 DNA polymerase III subunit epsilon [Gammaproteobacteria bacterium]